MAGFVNGLFLVFVAFFIFSEAVEVSSFFLFSLKRQRSSLSNTVKQIQPVNGLTRLVQLVPPVQVVKQWFTSRTQLVNHCFTTRTSCGLVYTPLVSLMIYTSPTARLVNHCFTTSMTRTNRTGHAKRNMPLYGWYQFVYIGQPSRRWKNKVALNVFFAKTNSWHPCPLKN